MIDAQVRRYRSADYDSVRRIYISTGYVGTPLRPELFRDYDLFAAFYLDYYSVAYGDNFFVFDGGDQGGVQGGVQGYINGALDTAEFTARFCAVQIPRIEKKMRALSPADYHRELEIARSVIRGHRAQMTPSGSVSARGRGKRGAHAERGKRGTHEVADTADRALMSVIAAYPAHLHINVSADAQRTGIGSRLLERYERHCRERGVAGIHLITSTYNKHACLFYEKHGYEAAHRMSGASWPELTDGASVVYVKRL